MHCPAKRSALTGGSIENPVRKIRAGLTGFPEWAEVLTGWGTKMLDALHTTAELLAVGLDLQKNALTSLMDHGPHLLGPTGEHAFFLRNLQASLQPAVEKRHPYWPKLESLTAIRRKNLLLNILLCLPNQKLHLIKKVKLALALAQSETPPHKESEASACL